MKTFKINDNLQVIAEYKKTRSGFKHEATLLKNDVEIEKTKINYYNRTWESYTFESVLMRLKEKSEKMLTVIELSQFEAMIKSPDRIQDDLAPFKMIANIATLGDIFSTTKKESNNWKTRMLKAGLENKGLTMPEDWETLTEEDKEIRLNGVIEQLG